MPSYNIAMMAQAGSRAVGILSGKMDMMGVDIEKNTLHKRDLSLHEWLDNGKHLTLDCTPDDFWRAQFL